jgi:hypothetical protein
MMKRCASMFLTLVAICALAMPAAAQNFSVTIGTAPPAPQYEVVPPPRAGYAWAPGYWRWEHNHHVWEAGHWMEHREGYRWEPDHWVRHEGGYSHVPGHWDR